MIPSLAPSNPANPAAGAAFHLSTPGTFNDDQFTTNYDREFKDGRDKISGRFFLSDFRSYLPFGAGDVPSTPGEQASYADLSFPVDLPVTQSASSA